MGIENDAVGVTGREAAQDAGRDGPPRDESRAAECGSGAQDDKEAVIESPTQTAGPGPAPGAEGRPSTQRHDVAHVL